MTQASRQRLAQMAAALWWGSLTGLGALVVPLLFRHLPTPALAGNMAAQLFSAHTWLALGLGLLLLLIFRSNQAIAPVGAAQTATFLIAIGMLLALLSEFAVAPRIVARQNLRLWHSLGSLLWLLQWLCAGGLLWHLTRPDSDPK